MYMLALSLRKKSLKIMSEPFEVHMYTPALRSIVTLQRLQNNYDQTIRSAHIYVRTLTAQIKNYDRTIWSVNVCASTLASQKLCQSTKTMTEPLGMHTYTLSL